MVIVNAAILTALASTGEGGTANPIVQLVPFLLIGLVFYFLIIRPQRRRQQQQQSLLKQLTIGDEIVTIGGFHGEIVALDDETLDLEIAAGVIVTLARNAVSKTITESVLMDDAGLDEDAFDDADFEAEFDADTEVGEAVEIDPLGDSDTDPDKR